MSYVTIFPFCMVLRSTNAYVEVFDVRVKGLFRIVPCGSLHVKWSIYMYEFEVHWACRIGSPARIHKYKKVFRNFYLFFLLLLLKTTLPAKFFLVDVKAVSPVYERFIIYTYSAYEL